MVSIKRMIWIMVISIPMGMIVIFSVFEMVGGLTLMGTIFVILLYLPVMIFAELYGFYRALVKHHGLKGKEKLFWGGKF